MSKTYRQLKEETENLSESKKSQWTEWARALKSAGLWNTVEKYYYGKEGMNKRLYDFAKKLPGFTDNIPSSHITTEFIGNKLHKLYAVVSGRDNF